MQKLYFSISEVAKIINEEQHILRYWEKEFPLIKPRKNRAGNRVYSNKDLSIIKIIKSLLREERLNLKQAKERLSQIDFSSFEQIDDSYEINKISSQNISAMNFIENDNKEISSYNKTLSTTDLKELKELLIDLKKILLN